MKIYDVKIYKDSPVHLHYSEPSTRMGARHPDICEGPGKNGLKRGHILQPFAGIAGREGMRMNYKKVYFL
jgi:hypothetical protein